MYTWPQVWLFELSIGAYHSSNQTTTVYVDVFNAKGSVVWALESESGSTWYLLLALADHGMLSLPGVLWPQESSRMEALPKHLVLTKLRGVVRSLDLESSIRVMVHMCHDQLI